ncbi:MAG: hypothetical protein WC749_02370 [Dehalococcoidia bacterium]
MGTYKTIFATDNDLQVTDSSGNVKTVITSTGGLYINGVAITVPSTLAFTAVDTTTVQTLQNKTLGTGTISSLETATSDTAVANYGITVLPYSTGAQAVTLSAPVAGAQKYLVLNSTLAPDTTGIFTAVYSGSTATYFLDNSTVALTAGSEKLYMGLGPPYACVHLIGISTAIWGTVSAYGNVKYSTQAVFST